MSTFFPAMLPAFFIRVRPASRKAKPACMNMTRIAVTTTQIVLAAMRRSWFLGTDLHPLEPAARPVVRDVADRSRPDETVARLVAASRRIDDRVDDPGREVILDDERQERLRQEPRLEHAAAVLVRDSALPPVTDRLDDRHADVTGRLLHRVDHRLDPLPDYDCLDLDHPHLPVFEHKKSAPGAEAPEAPMPPGRACSGATTPRP